MATYRLTEGMSSIQALVRQLIRVVNARLIAQQVYRIDSIREMLINNGLHVTEPRLNP